MILPADIWVLNFFGLWDDGLLEAFDCRFVSGYNDEDLLIVTNRPKKRSEFRWNSSNELFEMSISVWASLGPKARVPFSFLSDLSKCYAHYQLKLLLYDDYPEEYF